jgi:hypothetical protein
MSQRITVAWANLGPSILGKKNPRWVPRETGRQRLADSEFSARAIPVDRETKNHRTIDQLSPRLIALLARSADSLPTSLTAGKNVTGFAQSAPLSAVQAWWILRIVGRKGVALSRSSPKRVD